MYELEIETKYNTIHLIVDNLENEEVKEILNQPYVVEVKPKIFTGDIKKAKVLKKGGIKSEKKVSR